MRRGAGPVGTLAAYCAFHRGASRVLIIDEVLLDMHVDRPQFLSQPAFDHTRRRVAGSAKASQEQSAAVYPCAIWSTSKGAIWSTSTDALRILPPTDLCERRMRRLSTV